MARYLIPSDTFLKAIKPGDPRKRISDGDGLVLLLFVKPGEHGWRFDYRFAGRRNMLSFGNYPDTTLAIARRKADAARRLLAEGFDPSQQRKAEWQAQVEAYEDKKRVADGLPPRGSFEEVAREWYAVRKDGWARSYGDKIIARFENDVFPWIGKVPVAELTAPQLLEVIRRIEARGVVETAHRALLRAIDHYAATPVVRAALRLAPMLLLRPGELRFAEWTEIDLDGALWTVPSMRMKRELRQKLHGAPHLVPLSRQAVAVLRDLQPLTGNGPLVFRGERHHDRPMSDNTVNAALRAMGFSTDEVTGHGFRATARTMLHERLGFDPHVIEAQLAHSVQDALGRAYNRTEFLEQRRKMMQAWADYLDKLRKAPTDSADAKR